MIDTPESRIANIYEYLKSLRRQLKDDTKSQHIELEFCLRPQNDLIGYRHPGRHGDVGHAFFRACRGQLVSAAIEMEKTASFKYTKMKTSEYMAEAVAMALGTPENETTDPWKWTPQDLFTQIQCTDLFYLNGSIRQRTFPEDSNQLPQWTRKFPVAAEARFSPLSLLNGQMECLLTAKYELPLDPVSSVEGSQNSSLNALKPIYCRRKHIQQFRFPQYPGCRIDLSEIQSIVWTKDHMSGVEDGPLMYEIEVELNPCVLQLFDRENLSGKTVKYRDQLYDLILWEYCGNLIQPIVQLLGL